VILFDGVCNLCNGFVVWVIRRDPRAVFRFASLQSEAGRAVLAGREMPDSIVLADERGLHSRSGAVLRIAARLRFPWPAAAAFLLIPAPIRDAIYSWVARNRYRWFGKREECMIPTPELRARFLEDPTIASDT
jgi:predicted DCC family thiol-disulfide oxidoreductase YuxK